MRVKLLLAIAKLLENVKHRFTRDTSIENPSGHGYFLKQISERKKTVRTITIPLRFSVKSLAVHFFNIILHRFRITVVNPENIVKKKLISKAIKLFREPNRARTFRDRRGVSRNTRAPIIAKSTEIFLRYGITPGQ